MGKMKNTGRAQSIIRGKNSNKKTTARRSWQLKLILGCISGTYVDGSFMFFIVSFQTNKSSTFEIDDGLRNENKLYEVQEYIKPLY